MLDRGINIFYDACEWVQQHILSHYTFMVFQLTNPHLKTNSRVIPVPSAMQLRLFFLQTHRLRVGNIIHSVYTYGENNRNCENIVCVRRVIVCCLQRKYLRYGFVFPFGRSYRKNCNGAATDAVNILTYYILSARAHRIYSESRNTGVWWRRWIFKFI